MEETTLQFGVEIELLLGSRKKSHASWKALAKDLSKRLAKAGIANHINDSNDKSPDNYREWSIVPEVTIPSQPNKGLCKFDYLPPHSFPFCIVCHTLESLLYPHPIHHPSSIDPTNQITHHTAHTQNKKNPTYNTNTNNNNNNTETYMCNEKTESN
jgi:hypothetical protein